jgi:ribosome-associated toxin RatA of RatAB toxin-antitoxin module
MSTISIVVDAPADVVFRLCRDVERWQVLLPHYVRSRRVSSASGPSLVVDFVARRPLLDVLGLGLPVAWRARTWNEPGSRRLWFRHLAGATRGMEVSWRIEPEPSGCRVSIEHVFAPRLPGWAGLIDRAFTQPIASRTLTTFKAIAEALTEAELESGRASRPKKTS